MTERIDSWQSAIKARFYYLLRRSLNQKKRDGLKKWQNIARRRTAKFHSLFHNKYSAADLIDQLKARVPDDFEILMVHSAYDHLLPMYSGSPQQLLDELISYCGPERSLAMPAFCLGGRTRDKRAYYRNNVFDVRKTSSEMGLLTEIFRRKAGVKRSLHPTHSVCALGPRASELVAGHHLCQTRTGHGSPFEVMANRRCVIVGLGVEWFRVITQTHCAEDMLGDAFPIRFAKESFPVTMLDWDGSSVIYNLTVLSTSRVLDNTILRTFLDSDDLKTWRFNGSPLFATFADKITTGLISAAHKGLTVYGAAEQKVDSLSS